MKAFLTLKKIQRDFNMKGCFKRTFNFHLQHVKSKCLRSFWLLSGFPGNVVSQESSAYTSKLFQLPQLFAWMLLHSVRSTCSALLAFEKRRTLTAVGTQSNISSRDVARCSSICTLLPEVLGHLTWWTWMHLEISGGTRPTSLDNGLEPRVSVAWIKSEIFSHGFPALKYCWIMTLESSFVCLFLTRCIRGYCTLWDSYLFESSAWCHVLIRAQKLGKGLWLFSSLRSKRKNERGKGSALNPSLGWQRWFSRTTLEGTEQELGLCSYKRQINR